MTRRRLRVLVYFDAYFDYVRELGSALGEECELTVTGPARWSPEVTVPFGPATRYHRHDLPRVRHPARIAAARRFLRLADELRPDIVHVQQSGDPWFNSVLATTRFRFPMVHTIHDVVEHPGDRSQVPGAIRLQRAWTRRCVGAIVHADCLGDDLSSRWGVPRHRIHTVAHGELGSLYRSDAGHIPDRPPREPATILFYGRRWAYKGLPILVDALCQLAGRHHDLTLVIAGQGEDTEALLRRLPASVSVELHDHFVDARETVRLFDRATTVCLPYLEGSQSGVAALGLGMGTPVIASNVGGLPSMIRDERDGLLVPPGDVAALASAIARLLDDQDLQRRLSEAAADRCSDDLAWPTIAASTVDVYHRSLGE